jgi:23S rRNA (uracil1939-C5)-methyltransferase
MSVSIPRVTIESLDHDGRGVARVDGKAIFIEGALTGEVVEYASFRIKPKYELATVTRVVKASSQRVTPPCHHFGVCGGCSMQHLHPVSQIAAKQRVLEDAFWHIGRLHPEQLYAPICGPALGYRYRSRLSVRLVPNKGGVLVGFHEKRSSYVAALESCAILPPHVSVLIPELKRLVVAMSAPHRLPQIEVAIGGAQTALVLSHLEPLTETDRQHLRAFADRHGVVWYLQPKGPASARLFYPADAARLSYRLPEFDIDLNFQPTDFTQVNHGMNQMLVRRAMALLQPQAGERIADFFCGLGNFSLPMARRGAEVIGIEGSDALVARAEANAAANGLTARCRFSVANLFEMTPERFARLGPLDKLMIDPPRDGAVELVKALPATARPPRIVYISCNPATLARDAAILVREKGYVLRGAGIVSMFPHTSHVESIALFER